MHFDKLNKAWQLSVSRAPTSAQMETLTQSARVRVGRYRRDVRLRIAFGSIAFCLALAMLTAVYLLPGVWLGMRVALGLWAAALIACLTGLWSLRERQRASVPLQSHLQASLERLRREIAYHHSLRWRFWLPFTAGLGCALAQHISSRPDVSWLLVLAAVIGCGWGLVYGPRHWPERLQPEVDTLQVLLDSLSMPSHDTRAEHA